MFSDVYWPLPQCGQNFCLEDVSLPFMPQNLLLQGSGYSLMSGYLLDTCWYCAQSSLPFYPCWITLLFSVLWITDSLQFYFLFHFRLAVSAYSDFLSFDPVWHMVFQLSCLLWNFCFQCFNICLIFMI